VLLEALYLVIKDNDSDLTSLNKLICSQEIEIKCRTGKQ